MKQLFLKIYHFLTEPLYRRLQLDMKLDLQKLNQSHIEYQEKLTSMFIDEMMLFSARMDSVLPGKQGSDLEAAEHLFDDEDQGNFTEEEIAKIIKTIDNSGGVIEASKRHGISIRTLLRWQNKFQESGMRGIHKIKEMEREIAQLRSEVSDLAIENRRLKDQSASIDQSASKGHEFAGRS